MDNAVIENFFGLLKSELLYLQELDSIDQFKAELMDYLDYYNNRRCLHSSTATRYRKSSTAAALPIKRFGSGSS